MRIIALLTFACVCVCVFKCMCVYVCMCVCVLTGFLCRALLGDCRSLSIRLTCENVGLFCVAFIREGREGPTAFFLLRECRTLLCCPPSRRQGLCIFFIFFCVEKVEFFRLKVGRGLFYFGIESCTPRNEASTQYESLFIEYQGGVAKGLLNFELSPIPHETSPLLNMGHTHTHTHV